MHKKSELSGRERLLKLIDGDPKALESMERGRRFKFFLPGIKQWVIHIVKEAGLTIRQFLRGELKPRGFDVRIFNRCLIGVLSIMLVYLGVNIARFILKPKRVYNLTGKLDYQRQKKKLITITSLKPFGYYLREAQKRDIFSPQRVETVETVSTVSTDAPLPYTALKLVGVSYEGIPEALIEDTDTGKTYFVKRGDSVRSLKVMEIFRDKVRLSYDNKVIELK